MYPDDLKPYTQCHFFAGVGVWSYALSRAGWPDDEPVWTGSCPCQPFSAAGAGAGFDDKRHLWPHFHWLISERQPSVVFGEQVASKDADPWLDLVQADVEAMDYAFGAVAFPSAGIGAPHIRDRTYFLDAITFAWDHDANGNVAALQNWLDQPAPQPHPDPIAWMVGTAFWWTKEEAEKDAAATRLPIVPVGPLSGGVEAEQLREVIKHSDAQIMRQSMRISNQRAQLAEAQALLRTQDELLSQAYQRDIGTLLKREIREISSALSASAEPSAPKCGHQLKCARFENGEIVDYVCQNCRQVLPRVKTSAPTDCAICRDLGSQCDECEEGEFREWADRHFAAADYRKNDAGVFIQDWMRHSYGAWCARGALARKQ